MVNTSFIPLILKPGSVPPPMTNIEKLYDIATKPCLEVGIGCLSDHRFSNVLNSSLLSNVDRLDSPPNTKILSPITAAARPPLFEIIAGAFSHKSSSILYISLLFKFAPN